MCPSVYLDTGHLSIVPWTANGTDKDYRSFNATVCPAGIHNEVTIRTFKDFRGPIH